MRKVELWTVVYKDRYSDKKMVKSTRDKMFLPKYLWGRKERRSARYYRHKVPMCTLAELPDGAEWWRLNGDRLCILRHEGDNVICKQLVAVNEVNLVNEDEMTEEDRELDEALKEFGEEDDNEEDDEDEADNGERTYQASYEVQFKKPKRPWFWNRIWFFELRYPFWKLAAWIAGRRKRPMAKGGKRGKR